MSIQKPKWTDYPHEDYAHTIDEIHAKAAWLDAWRRFLQPSFLNALHAVGAEIFINEYSISDGMVNFPATVTEARAREVIGGLLRPEAGDEKYTFLRERLTDPRAWVKFPLSFFVETDVRAVPLFRISIRQHWRVLMEHFTFGRKQKNYVNYDTLLFGHPQCDPRFAHNPHEVASLEIEKGKPVGERREALLQEAENHAREWQFSILERWTIRHLNNEPQPEDD